jgi:hypothetical protein
MYEHLKLGLARGTDFFHQKQVDDAIRMSFEDIRDSIECLTTDMKGLQDAIHAILYGEPPRIGSKC